MRKILVFLGILLASCSVSDKKSSKILTKNIPSTDKLVLEGKSFSGRAASKALPRAAAEYGLIERLYNTVWYQTEEEFDDGKLEVETELVAFNANSLVVEREIENGVMEAVERDDYKKLDIITGLSADSNSVIVKAKEADGDIEYEGYWLENEYNLYIVEGNNQDQVSNRLEAIKLSPSSANRKAEKYLLSTNG